MESACFQKQPYNCLAGSPCTGRRMTAVGPGGCFLARMPIPPPTPKCMPPSTELCVILLPPTTTHAGCLVARARPGH